jgi:hypothetical protein
MARSRFTSRVSGASRRRSLRSIATSPFIELWSEHTVGFVGLSRHEFSLIINVLRLFKTLSKFAKRTPSGVGTSEESCTGHVLELLAGSADH